MLSKMKIIIGLLLVVSGWAYWVSYDQNNDAFHQQYLISEWQQGDSHISTIDQLTISFGDDQLNLNKTAGFWVLNNGFYASIEPLFKLIQSLKNAEIVEIKTANPTKHHQLELADDDLLVNIYQSGELKHAIHIGKKSTDGLTFVRYAGEDQTYTVNGLEAISTEVNNWALKTVLDIAATDIQAVSLKPLEGESILVNRNPENGAIQLAELPMGYQIQTNADLSQVFNGLSRFMIDEAIPAESWPANVNDVAEVPATLAINYQLNSAASIEINLYQQEDGYFLTIDSSQYPQYAGWVMKVAEYKFNALNRKLSDFIEPINMPEEPSGVSDDSVEVTIE